MELKLTIMMSEDERAGERMSTPNVYSSLDPNEIAQDRHELKMKIMRHLNARNGKGTDDIDDMTMDDGSVGTMGTMGTLGTIGRSTVHSTREDVRGKMAHGQDYREGCESLNDALYNHHPGSNSVISNNRSHLPLSSTISASTPSATSTAIPGRSVRRNVRDERLNPKNHEEYWKCVKLEIPTEQHPRKRLLSILYIMIVLVWIVTYLFFVESIKLTEYTEH